MWRILGMPPFFQAGVVPAGGGWVQMQCVRVGQQQQRLFAVAAENCFLLGMTQPQLLCCCVWYVHAGIAWDPSRQRLFLTGKYWPRVFEVKLIPVEGTPDAATQQKLRACFQRMGSMG